MSMTKHDYDKIAEQIRKALRTWTPDTAERRTAIYAIKDTAVTIATELENNSNFDRTVFLQKAGVTE